MLMETTPSDEQLFESWLMGELWAFEVFYQRHSARVATYISRKGVPAIEVPEVVQEIFLKLHSNIEHFDPEKKALPWFFTLVHNACVDHLKRGGKSKSQVSYVSGFDFETLADNRSESDRGDNLDVDEALATLASDQQRIVNMRCVEELSFKEMALQTGKSEVTLRKTYSRALQNLRDWFSKKENL